MRLLSRLRSAPIARFAASLVMVIVCPALHAQAPDTTNILPAPTRALPIGRVTYHWVDSSRAESFAPAPGARREILVDFWYPAASTVARPAAAYLPDLLTLKRAMGDSLLRRRFSPMYAQMEAGRLQTHSVESAPDACPRTGCPLLVFSHGGGVDRSAYTAQYEDLASHGYVVAVIAHPYDTHLVVFPDGRIVRNASPPPDTTRPDSTRPLWRRQLAREEWSMSFNRRVMAINARDIRFVIDQLTREARSLTRGVPFRGKLDLTRIGALGHSLGGESAALACQTDRRIRACLNQDGVMGGAPFSRDAAGRTMEQPFMYFGRPYNPRRSSDAALASIQMTRMEEDSVIRAVAGRVPELLADIPGGAFWVELTTPGAGHMSFSDEVILEAVGDSVKMTKALVALRFVRSYTRAFFDKTLLGRSNTPLDRPPHADSAFISVKRFPAQPVRIRL